MSAGTTSPSSLPALPRDGWEATKDTLHRWARSSASAYRAGAAAAGWDTADLASSWCPDPHAAVAG